MLLQRGRHAKRNFYILAVLIPILLVSALFVMIGIAPFGPHNLLVSDLSTQYLQFRKNLIDLLLTTNRGKCCYSP